MELNLILFSCLQQKCIQWGPRRVLDHYFNVCLGVSGREMELTRTCCFEFDQKRRPDSKRLLLRTICFYFMVAGFTYLSLLPEVDKIGNNYFGTLRGPDFCPRPSGSGRMRATLSIFDLVFPELIV